MFRSANFKRINIENNTHNLALQHSLYDAVLDGKLTSVEFLLEYRKINPNYILLEYDAAPLHIAAGIGTDDSASQIVQLLLTYGANPNIQTSDGTSPLMIACIFGRIAVAKLLLKYGADPLLEDSDGINSVGFASENGYLFMHDVLNNHDYAWSILESSDGSLCKRNNLTKQFFSFFNDESAQESKSVFSDIDSDVNCIEICALDTAFCESPEESISSSGTFVSFKDKIIHTSGSNLLRDNFQDSYQNYYISDNSASSGSSKSACSQISAISYRTDRIKFELKRNNINHGPITATTKQVYYNLIKKVIKGKKKGPFFVNEFSNFPEVLRSTLNDKSEDILRKWCNLERQLTTNFSQDNRMWRGGKEKQFFTYLLLDPSITNDLPSRRNEISEGEIWRTFILSIFYIGKGKNSRPFSHLFEALKNNVKKTVNKKICRIQNIWESSHGVICLHTFHNIISAEAHTREALMIDAVGLSNLTNIQSGEYYGIVKNWSIKQKQQLGVVLLHKGLQIYLAEGERQIFPTDLK